MNATSALQALGSVSARARRWCTAPVIAAGIACFAMGLPAAQAANLDFKLVNRTDQPIVGLWASPVSSSSWGQAFDNTFVQDGGGSQTVRFNGSGSDCYYGVCVQFSEGAVPYWSSLNLCAIRGMQIYVSNGEVKATTW